MCPRYTAAGFGFGWQFARWWRATRYLALGATAAAAQFGQPELAIWARAAYPAQGLLPAATAAFARLALPKKEFFFAWLD